MSSADMRPQPGHLSARHAPHAHHLKGLLHCGSRGSWMLLDFATNPRHHLRLLRRLRARRQEDHLYPPGRAPWLNGWSRTYAAITISETTYRDLAARVDAAFDKRTAGRDQELADLTANRARLEAESDKPLAAHFADAIDLPTLKRHQDRIRAGLADIDRRLAEPPHRRPSVPPRQAEGCSALPVLKTRSATDSPSLSRSRCRHVCM